MDESLVTLGHPKHPETMLHSADVAGGGNLTSFVEAYCFPSDQPLGSGAYGVVWLAKHRRTWVPCDYFGRRNSEMNVIQTIQMQAGIK